MDNYTVFVFGTGLGGETPMNQHPTVAELRAAVAAAALAHGTLRVRGEIITKAVVLILGTMTLGTTVVARVKGTTVRFDSEGRLVDRWPGGLNWEAGL